MRTLQIQCYLLIISGGSYYICYRLIISNIQVADNHWSDKRLITAAVVNHLDTIPFKAISRVCSLKTDDEPIGASELNGDRCVPIRNRIPNRRIAIPVATCVSLSSERKKSVNMGADRDYR
jgi:hypothetical protein